VDFIAKRPSGNGAVRDLMEALLDAQGLAVLEVFTRP
jgi:3-deoxy-D-manno-octulosonate 8-phosphate phosphatase KdsC-like HAD superfamily phosphatase